MGYTLYPYQEWLAKHALELAPGVTVGNMGKRKKGAPLLRFRTVIVVIARQNGKTEFGKLLGLFFLLILGKQKVISAAHTFAKAKSTVEEAAELVEATSFTRDQFVRWYAGNTDARLELVGGRRWIPKAAKGAARGFSADLIQFDELLEQKNWATWSAISKTMMARPDGLMFSMSNAGDIEAIVLQHYRYLAHELLGDPDGIVDERDKAATAPDNDPALLIGEDEAAVLQAADDDAEVLEIDTSTLGYFEWSAAPVREVSDRAGWVEANPALGFGLLTERNLATSMLDDAGEFSKECLCQWPVGLDVSPFPDGSWESLRDDTSRVAPGERIVLCVDSSPTTHKTYIAIAGERDDGLIHVGVIGARIGGHWVPDFLLSDDAPPFSTVVVQAKGSSASWLVDKLREHGIDVTEWGGSNLAGAWSALHDDVARRGAALTRHRGQPLLDLAASASLLTKLGGADWIDRRNSPVDASPLVAVAGARWGLVSTEQRKSAYEDSGLLVF